MKVLKNKANRPKTVVTRFIKEVWNQKKVDSIPKFISRSYVAHLLGGGGEVVGTRGVRLNVIKAHSQFKGLKIKVRKIVEDGDHTASWITLTSQNKVMNELIIHKVKNNLITEAWSIGGNWLKL
jgi:hypothetical protein